MGKAKAVTDRELNSVLGNALQNAADYATASLQETRRKAWNYYFNRKRGDEKPGRSTLQSTDVADAVESLMSTIMPSYSTDHIAQFEPEGPGDEQAAAAESEACNSLFVESNQGFIQLTNAIKSALLQRNAYVKLWVEEVQDTQSIRIPDPTPERLAAAVAQIGQDATVIDDKIVVMRETQKFRARAIEPAYMFLDPNHESISLQDCQYVAELWYPTRSELVQMGIPKSTVEELDSIEDRTTTSAGSGTNLDLLAKFIDGVSDTRTDSPWASQWVECYWMYARVDRDGDGIAELKCFLWSNNRVLLEEDCDYIPYASGTGWVVPFRHSGLSVYDKLRITQDEKTNAKRQLADNLNIGNNVRTWGVEGMVNVDDALNSRPGGHVRVKSPEAFGQVPHMDMSAASLAYLQYLDTIRAEQVGASLDLQQADDQLVKAGVTAQSVDRQISSREQIASMVNRTLAETLVRDVFILMHTVLRTEWEGPIMYKSAGDWQETYPGTWSPRTRVNITVGMSPGERSRHDYVMQTVLAKQEQMLAMGQANILVSYDGYYKAIQDWLKANMIDNAEAYFLNPQSQQSQQGQQASAQQSQQMAGMQMQQAQQAQQVEQYKAQDATKKWQAELRFDYDKLAADQEAKEAELTVQAISQQRAETNGATNGSREGTEN